MEDVSERRQRGRHTCEKKQKQKQKQKEAEEVGGEKG
jgi:hypothetical protein